MILRIYESNEKDSDELELDDAEQKMDSKITSINSSKLPAIFKLVKFQPGTIAG